MNSLNFNQQGVGTNLDTTVPCIGLSATSTASRKSCQGPGLGSTQKLAETNPFLFPATLLDPVTEASPLSSANISPCSLNVTPSPDGTDTDELPCWWLLHTKPRQEKKLADELKRMDIPHYLPAVEHAAVTRGRSRVTWVPLFAGYFFLWGTRTQRLIVLETNRLVGAHQVTDGKSLRAKLCELADLIQRGVPLTAESRLEGGRRVRVKSGSLRNREGTVIKRAGKTRLFIMVSELLGGVSLAIEEHFLEPLY